VGHFRGSENPVTLGPPMPVRIKRYRHRIGLSKNKVRKSEKFFDDQISTIFAPRSTTQSPQFHQQITIKKRTIFQNPPQKREQNSQNSRPVPQIFFVKLNPKNPSPHPE
jgi:hypothetical protein